jgi:methylmalonyl-CoA mutase
MADTDIMTDLPLASEFPPATREQWRKLVDGVLKGASFEKTLVSKTYDGLKIEPLYGRRADATALAGRAPAAPWQVMARVDHPDPKQANKQALEDLENGANGLILVCPGSVGSQGFGIDTSADGLARILDGIYLDAGAPLEFQLTRDAKDVPAHVAALIKQRGLDPAACDLRIGFDPIGLMAAGSSAPAPWDAIAPLFARMTRTLADEGFRGPFAVADARVIHNAGGSEVQELAYALSVAVAYWRALEAGGVSLDDARRMIFFRLSADADQFMTMAKFRSARKLWARVEEAAGLAPQPAFIAAETAWRMMTQRDPYVNMLRVTIATFAAGLGGANAVTVLPFTSALGLPDAFARRVARNTQLILLEESNLAKVSDPAAGSGGIEDLTDQLCRAAWTLFQEIEKTGGIASALESGLVQTKVAETRSAREKAIATRRDPLTGISEFAHLSENSIKVLQPASQVAPAFPENALPSIRLAEPFEKLRNASDAMLKEKGARPKVFLATLGKPSDFIARVTFARNFFEAGGIEAVEFSLPNPSPAPSPSAPDRPLPMGEVKSELAALASAFKASGAALACLCSSDAVYAQEATGAAQALAAAGAEHIYLAGRPGDAFGQVGIRDFIYTGCDAVGTLKAAYDRLTP